MTQQATGIEAQVCADIAARQALGVAKYGVTVQDNPLALLQWMQHAYEECLDQAVYLRRAMQALAEQPAQQEPVAWRWLYNGQPDSKKHFSMPGPDAEVISRASACEFPRTVQYLYTSPPAQRKPLTDEQIEKELEPFPLWIERWDSNDLINFARAIEAAHGIKV